MSGFIMLMVAMQLPLGASPSGPELAEASQWATAKFAGAPLQAAARPRIEVMANNDPVQANGRSGKPMRVGDVVYTRGLYCHARSKLVVHLPEPGTTFEALVGVDSNDQTSGGRGSVVFALRAADETLWESGVMREGMPGVPVCVNLGGLRQFILEVDDAGDGISCDQADWAEARVMLEGGTVCWLAELPIEEGTRAPYDTSPFFSFTYGGKPSAEFLSAWTLAREAKAIDAQRRQHTLRYRDPQTGLEVRCEAVEYLDFPTVEWTLHFKNTGTKNTPILSDIQAIDTAFGAGTKTRHRLHYNKGDNCTAASFEPLEMALPPKGKKRIANTGGRPTQTAFPYFNIASGNQGLIFVVSWAGQWSAEFVCREDNALTLRAGQEKTHFTLFPGEEIRTPLTVLQFWRGSRWHAQNVWRSWMIAHNLPRPGGKLPPVPELAACSSHQFAEMINANTASQTFFIDQYLARGIKLDYWWMDAGWYWNKAGWPHTGTWEVDTNRFPGGLRPISDHAHAKDVDIIVWFEPERVARDTWLSNTHPEWIHGGRDGGLLNLGNPEAWQWLTEHVDRLITEQGIDLYRQDFNIDPLPFWRKNDPADRQGITEIRHVEGYFAYWDELRRRHPELLIDSCASGGRRNDLETLRRAVPLLRSDYIMEPIGNQCHSYALSAWFPFYGTGSSKTDPYLIRSTLCPHYTACWDQRDDRIDFGAIKRLMDQWKAFAPNYFGDYYPVTDYALDNDQWIAWQFDRPESGEGMVQAFRREACVYETGRLPLHGLLPDAAYRVTDIDRPESASAYRGQTLMQEGLPVTIAQKPGTAFFVYTRQ